MPKVGQTFHLTFRPNPEDRYTFAKVTLELADIDTSIPFEKQQKEIDATVRASWEYILKRVDEQVDDVANAAGGA